ncbi:MAG: ATP-dependent DNA helicase RecG, partial [Actinomycetota bacterium]|nr:ATP-dependent DNA helicase RecG [Actinomycetota bacterium]
PAIPHRPGVRWWYAPLTELPGVGKATADRAAAIGVHDLGDLLEHLPSRYLAYDSARPVSGLADGEEATVRVVLDSISVIPTRRRGLKMVRAKVHDATGSIAAIWFNQGYLAGVLTPGDELMIRGQVKLRPNRQITVKAHEVLGAQASEGLHTEALPARRLRELVDAARPYVSSAPEVLPQWMRERVKVGTRADALAALHFPRTAREPRSARRRLAFEELLVLQMGLIAVRRHDETARRALPLKATGEITGVIRAALPFTLTREQERVAREVARDIARPQPMRRLLQGEVGAGKTVVAALACAQAVEAGAQAAILVPTETLAEQHLRTLDSLLAPAGIEPVLITGNVPKAERERREMAVATGTARVVVGTQALLVGGVEFDRLGLVVVDEQHRFGVEQRQALAEQAGDDGMAAHLLYMTATPIPRTLALTAYGDLRVSAIRGRPPGRSEIATRWVRDAEREMAYDDVRAELRRGRQAYVICPLVEDGESGIAARSAVAEFTRLRQGPFAAFRVGLAHGAQRPDERRAAMAAFAAGETDMLVATTVVEVGIDVPNATVMLIEDADRFGLAQLHQLRGRVGRGEHPGTCLIFAEPGGEEGMRRLEALVQTNDGFRLADIDLEIRGEGSILGLRQSGPTDLRFARLSRDRRTLAEARQVARATLRRDPHLEEPEHVLLADAVRRAFPDLPRLLDA